MRSTIDKAGRLVLPKSIREEAQLEGGTEVEVRLIGGRVEIEPVPMDVSLERRGVAGGQTYDALIVIAALKAKADTQSQNGQAYVPSFIFLKAWLILRRRKVK